MEDLATSINTGSDIENAFMDERLGEDASPDTQSLTSSILQPREAWGRTYHKFRAGENDYWGPNDKRQSVVHNVRHGMLNRLLEGNLFLAPLHHESRFRVLDVGCGNGIWAVDFADAHADAQVEGIDLSPTQPTWVPPNCEFVVDDMEYEWTYPPNHFHFVHFRCLMGAVKDWPALYRQAFNKMRPGGYVEHLEMSMAFTSEDGSITEDPVLTQWSQTFIACGERLGKTFLVADKTRNWIVEAGYESVEERRYQLPVGAWSEDEKHQKIGEMNFEYCFTGAEGWALYLLTNVLGWSFEACQVFIADFRRALEDQRNRIFYEVVVVWGRKPMLR